MKNNNSQNILKSILSILAFVLLTLVISSCYSNSNYSLEGEVLMHESELDELTEKEKHFQDSLERIGIKITIERTVIGRAGKDYARCKVIVDSAAVVTPSNIDSLEKFRSNIVNELYKQILSDSVIFCIDRISTEMKGLRYEGVKEKDFFYLKDYMKSTLEINNLFRVEKEQMGKLKRILLTKVEAK